MRKQYFLLLLFTCYSILSLSIITEHHLTLHFKPDKHLLTPEHEKLIQEFLSQLELSGDYEFLVKGHTDQDGSFAYNMALSERRTTSISEFLQKQGVDQTLTSSLFSGEHELLVNALTDKAKRKNRRVDITFKKYEFADINELQAELSSDYSTNFKFDSSTKNLLVGHSGTRLFVEANSFSYPDGTPYTDEVNFVLTESLSLDAFIKHGLSTECENQMLISGGMFKTEAFDQFGNPLELNKSTPIETSMPSKNMRSDMMVFTSDSGTNWELTTQAPLIAPLDESKVSAPVVTETFEFKAPNFALEGKPMRPTVSSKPRLPAFPDSSRYFRPIPWYKAFSKKAINQKSKQNYEVAMNKYNEKLEKYERRLNNFQTDSATIGARMNLYQIQMRAWDIEFNKEKIAFMEKSMEEQYQEWIHRFPSSNQRYSMDDNFYSKLELLDTPLTLANSVYVFNQVALGWVNIDCFSGSNGPKRDVLVNNDIPKDDAIAFLMFPRINSCISMNFSQGEFKQLGVPKGEKTKVIAYKVIDGQVYFCEEDITHIDNPTLEYVPISFTEFKEKIKNLA